MLFSFILLIVYAKVNSCFSTSVKIAESEQGVAQAILRGIIDFKREPWPSVSESAKDLVRHMLEPDPKLRLTAKQVLGIVPSAPALVPKVNYYCFFILTFVYKIK